MTTLSSLILLPTISSDASDREMRLGDWEAWLEVEEWRLFSTSERLS